jgi:hypothetical protein
MNIYYNPEHFELRPVAEIDYSDGNYCFDLRVVWEHRPTGDLLTMRDSGCSCPTPFEDLSLESLDKLDVDELVREARSDGRANQTAADCADFLRKVREAARDAGGGRATAASRIPQQRYGWLEHWNHV